MPRHSLIITDDHQLFAEGLAALLRPAHDVVGIAGSGSQLLELLQRVRPDCVILDLSMPGRSGLEVIPEVRRQWPAVKLVVLSMHRDRALVHAVLSEGAHGYVTKDAPSAELLAAIERVMAGEQFISAAIPKNSDLSGLRASHQALASLTPRQEEVFVLVSRGYSSAAIAQCLGLSESTVTFHRAALRRKLGIESELGLNRFAVLLFAAKDGADQIRAGKAFGKSRPGS